MAKNNIGKNLSNALKKLFGEGIEFKASPDLDRLQKNLDLFNSKEIYVGFNEKSGMADDGTTSLVDIASFNEFGTSTIPARPFLSDTIEKHQDEIKKLFADGIKAVQNGADPMQQLNRIGVGAVGMVQKEIVDGEFAPNAPSTIKQKGSDKPLIDTGRMRQNVVYEVR